MSVVIPAFNAERTLGAVLDALTHDPQRPDEVIVVDDGSTDLTAQIARAHGARVVDGGRVGYAGGARNRGWDAATGDVVVFLDSDAVPLPGFGEGVRRAAREFPGAIVGCARRFAPHTAWSWVAHLQIETPYLERGRAARRAVRVLVLHARAASARRCASTRATAARTPSSARTRSIAASASSSTRATPRCTTTTATRSRSSAASRRASPSPPRGSVRCSARACASASRAACRSTTSP